MMMMMASFFLLFRSKEFLFVRWKDETRARKSTKKPSSAALFGSSLAAFGGFSNLFFSAFSFVSKKSSKSALWEEIAQSFQTDTRAVVSRKKNFSLLYNIHKFYRA
jgi:hypothetical protein